MANPVGNELVAVIGVSATGGPSAVTEYFTTSQIGGAGFLSTREITSGVSDAATSNQTTRGMIILGEQPHKQLEMPSIRSSHKKTKENIMSILTEIGAFFLGVGTKTLTFVMGIVKALAENPQVQDIAAQEVQKAEEAALAAVAAGNVMTGVQKFAAAQTGVVAQLTAAGLPVVMNQVNIAIEGAVANMKTATPAAS